MTKKIKRPRSYQSQKSQIAPRDDSKYNAGLFGPVTFLDEDNEDHSITQIFLEEATREKLLSAGFRYAMTEYWVTNLDMLKLKKGVHLLSGNPEFGKQLAVIAFPRVHFFDAGIHIFYDQEFKRQFYQDRKIAQGNYLRILLSSQCMECLNSTADDELEGVVEQVRMIFGIASAKERITRQILHLDKSRTGANLKTLFFRDDFGDGDDPGAIIKFSDSLTIARNAISIPQDARLMISNALTARKPWQRFILIWFAIEALLGPDGKVREKWCKQLPHGQKINLEMLRLRNVRVQQAHFGSMNADELDCISAMWITRLACIKDPSLVSLVAAAYAGWIDKHEGQLGVRHGIEKIIHEFVLVPSGNGSDGP